MILVFVKISELRFAKWKEFENLAKGEVIVTHRLCTRPNNRGVLR
jgi:hypothetical protein